MLLFDLQALKAKIKVHLKQFFFFGKGETVKHTQKESVKFFSF